MVATLNLKVTQGRVLAVYNFPTPNLKATQVRVMVATSKAVDINVTQARVLAVARGRTENRHLRAWGFTLDEHDYYVLRLGETETLVCDLDSKDWYVWDGDGLDYWRAHQGFHWVGMGQKTYSDGAVCNVIAGDDDLGILWQLRPSQNFDYGAYSDAVTGFTRILTGILPARLRDTIPCYGVYATVDLGNPAYTGAAFTLKISDDGGKTFDTLDPIVLTAGDYEQEVAWRSLGIIEAPGRIFWLEDDGASIRVDGLDMVD